MKDAKKRHKRNKAKLFSNSINPLLLLLLFASDNCSLSVSFSFFFPQFFLGRLGFNQLETCMFSSTFFFKFQIAVLATQF